MAQLDRSFVRLRFRLGEGNVKGRQRYTNTAAFIARKVAFSYAQDQYEFYKENLEAGIEGDVRRELTNLASLYRRHIIGSTTDRPTGIIRSVIGGAQSLALSSALPRWAPRNARYLKRKLSATGRASWFDNRGWRTHKGQHWSPSDTGLLFAESRADTWETIFGPIRVVFRKSRILTEADAQAAVIIDGSKKAKIQIGTVSVYAMNKLTPAMLPALRTGDPSAMTPDTGNDELMDLVASYDQRLAYRLGQRSSLTKRYRPTLEPFLGFFLTRSIPAAIQSRIQRGSLGRITRGS